MGTEVAKGMMMAMAMAMTMGMEMMGMGTKTEVGTGTGMQTRSITEGCSEHPQRCGIPSSTLSHFLPPRGQALCEELGGGEERHGPPPRGPPWPRSPPWLCPGPPVPQWAATGEGRERPCAPPGAVGTPRGRGPPCRVEQALPPLCPQLPARRVGNIHQGTTMSIIYRGHSLLWDGGLRRAGGGVARGAGDPNTAGLGHRHPDPGAEGPGGTQSLHLGGTGGTRPHPNGGDGGSAAPGGDTPRREGTPRAGAPRGPTAGTAAGAAPGRAEPGRGLPGGSCVFKRWLAPGCSCCFCAIETVEIHYS